MLTFFYFFFFISFQKLILKKKKKKKKKLLQQKLVAAYTYTMTAFARLKFKSVVLVSFFSITSVVFFCLSSLLKSTFPFFCCGTQYQCVFYFILVAELYFFILLLLQKKKKKKKGPFQIKPFLFYVIAYSITGDGYHFDHNNISKTALNLNGVFSPNSSVQKKKKKKRNLR